MKRKGHQVSLGPALGSMLGRLDRKNAGAYANARAILAWERCAGDTISKHTTGAHLRDGVLVVYVDSNAYSTQYAAMSEQFRSRVNEELGEELVKGLRFTVSRKVADTRKVRESETASEDFYRKDDTPSIPLSEVERAQVESSVTEIPDRELRDAVLRATVADLEWKKGLSTLGERQERREGS